MTDSLSSCLVSSPIPSSLLISEGGVRSLTVESWRESGLLYIGVCVCVCFSSLVLCLWSESGSVEHHTCTSNLPHPRPSHIHWKWWKLQDELLICPYFADGLHDFSDSHFISMYICMYIIVCIISMVLIAPLSHILLSWHLLIMPAKWYYQSMLPWSLMQSYSVLFCPHYTSGKKHTLCHWCTTVPICSLAP